MGDVLDYAQAASAGRTEAMGSDPSQVPALIAPLIPMVRGRRHQRVHSRDRTGLSDGDPGWWHPCLRRPEGVPASPGSRWQPVSPRHRSC